MEETFEVCTNCVENCYRLHGQLNDERKFYFFKILIGEFSKQLRIPPAFAKHIEYEDSSIAILESPSGEQWQLTLERTMEGLILGKGWKEFVRSHSLQSGDLLVFRYNGDLHFTVKIFDRTACERDYLIHVGNGKGRSFFEENQGEKDINVRNSHVPLCKDRKDKIPGKKGRGRPCASKNVSFARKKRVRVELADQTNSNPIIKNVFVEQETDRETIVIDSSDERDCDRERSKTGPSNLNLSFEDGVCGMDNYQWQHYVSSRRPVIEGERARAWEMATSFNSSNPCFRVVMKRSNVYVTFFLNIPIKFIRNYCPNESQNIILHDPHGRTSMVRYIFMEDRGFLSAGWKRFSSSNNLEEGDVCVFELLHGKFEFHVHIFRVVDRIEPPIIIKKHSTQ